MRAAIAMVWAAAAAATLAGCGFTSSPGDSLTFKAPKGWRASPGIMGFMQFWQGPADGEVLMLIRSPKPLKTSEVFSNADLRDADLQTEKPIDICGNQPARYFKAKGKWKSQRDSTVEMVMSNAGGATYMAMYVHPQGTPANPDAETAIHQLCVRA
jgi:hypothetical protein